MFNGKTFSFNASSALAAAESNRRYIKTFLSYRSPLCGAREWRLRPLGSACVFLKMHGANLNLQIGNNVCESQVTFRSWITCCTDICFYIFGWLDWIYLINHTYFHFSLTPVIKLSKSGLIIKRRILLLVYKYDYFIVIYLWYWFC